MTEHSSRLSSQISEVVGALNDAGVGFALIGGLALAHNRDELNMQEVRGYFALFQREALLDELINEINPGG